MLCQLQQSSMAGGGGAVSLEAFNFLEVWCKSFNIFLDTTITHWFLDNKKVQELPVWFRNGFGTVLALCP